MSDGVIPFRVVEDSTLIHIDGDGWVKRAEQYHEAYRAATPFPHIVLDGLFPEAILDQIVAEVQQTEKDVTKNFYGAQKKSGSYSSWKWGPYTRQLMAELNSAPWLEFLQVLTGIEGLIPDPYYYGGGIHETSSGGFLKVHTDFNYHQVLKLDRRLNLLLYLNRRWRPEYGGDLELWSQDMKRREATIAPGFNRMVIFSTTDFSYHGHPDPLQCPVGITRKSLALYYYSNGRPRSENRFERGSSTNYQPRPGEVLNDGRRRTLRSVIRQALPLPVRERLSAMKRRLSA